MMLDKTAFMSADRAAFVYSCSVRDFRAQSANHLVKFGTSERESFDSVRDFRAQSACVCISRDFFKTAREAQLPL